MVDNNKTYDASNIQILEGLEPVRKRPGMYIGTTGSDGLHHLVWEIVDNSIDEALAGHASEIVLELLPGEVVRVTDNGRGIPVDIHPHTNRPAVETIFQHFTLVVSLMANHIKYLVDYTVLVLQ